MSVHACAQCVRLDFPRYACACKSAEFTEEPDLQSPAVEVWVCGTPARRPTRAENTARIYSSRLSLRKVPFSDFFRHAHPHLRVRAPLLAPQAPHISHACG